MSSKNGPDAPAARLPRWSLAARLTLWYAASSFVLLAASTGFLYWSLHNKLEAEDDQFMAEKVQLVRALLRDRPDRPVPLSPATGRAQAEGAPTSFYLRVLGADGRVLLATEGMDAILPAALFPPAGDAGQVRGHEMRLPDGRCF